VILVVDEVFFFSLFEKTFATEELKLLWLVLLFKMMYTHMTIGPVISVT